MAKAKKKAAKSGAKSSSKAPSPAQLAARKAFAERFKKGGSGSKSSKKSSGKKKSSSRRESVPRTVDSKVGTKVRSSRLTDSAVISPSQSAISPVSVPAPEKLETPPVPKTTQAVKEGFIGSGYFGVSKFESVPVERNRNPVLITI